MRIVLTVLNSAALFPRGHPLSYWRLRENRRGGNEPLVAVAGSCQTSLTRKQVRSDASHPRINLEQRACHILASCSLGS